MSNKNASESATTNTFSAGGVDTGVTANGAAVIGLVVGANSTINVSGAANMVMGQILFGTGSVPNNNVTLNAGHLTSNLSGTLGTGNDILTSGSKANRVFIGSGIDTVNISKLTAVADTVIFNAVGTNDAKAN